MRRKSNMWWLRPDVSHYGGGDALINSSAGGHWEDDITGFGLQPRKTREADMPMRESEHTRFPLNTAPSSDASPYPRTSPSSRAADSALPPPSLTHTRSGSALTRCYTERCHQLDPQSS